MAITNVGSVELAWLEWQRQAIPHIAKIAYDGGADIDMASPDWQYKGVRKGFKHWQNSGQRDIVCFPQNPHPQEYKRVPGQMSTNDLDPITAIVDNLINETDIDQPPATVRYERGKTITRRTVDTGTLGISITAYIEGQSGGGESSGGSYVKAGLSTTLSAEYSHALEQGSDDSDVVELTKSVIPKARKIAIIEQGIQRGRAVVKIKEKLILDPSWQVVDYKKLRRKRHNWLANNRDWSGWNGRSRIVWKVDGLADLRAQLEGRHPEYPGAHGKNVLGDRGVRNAFDWLEKEDNRTVESETTVTFDNAYQGDAVIRYQELGA